MTGVVLLAAEQLPILQLKIELRIAQAIDKASSRIWGNVDGLEDSFVDRGPRPTSSSLHDLETTFYERSTTQPISLNASEVEPVLSSEPRLRETT